MNFNQDIQSLENVCKRAEVSTVPLHRCRLVDATSKQSTQNLQWQA